MFRYMFALGLIIVGMILVLDNIGLVEVQMDDYWGLIIPVLFMLLGVKLFIDDFKYKGGSWIFGSLLVIFGGLLLLGELAIINFSFSDITKLWPLLIIYIGYSIIKPTKKKYVHGKIKKKYVRDNMSYGKRIFSVGDHEYKQSNWKVEPMNLKNAAGNCYMDFTKAFIPDKEIPITINNWAGDVQLLLPEHLPFRIDASVKVGDINVLDQKVDGINRHIFYESSDYDAAVRKLDINVKLKAGDIRVDVV
ncbi:cell wall-active antibiotics response protein LiaF [Lentibacillus sp. N15]|uniref:cell wall-active antibiotics response protein LiaF n=1 Tax=Lentibacillus songyuanensis TaxID=3136161 RepID=UPI0031B9C478